jgi:soluble lytic murein transglycosylase-like protein
VVQALRRAAGVLVVLVTLAGAGQAATTYRVRPGDSLSAIARRHRTTVDALVARNGIADPNRIRAGAVLTVDGTVSPHWPEKLQAAPDRVDLAPLFDAAARDHGVPADLLKALAWVESGWQNDKVSPAGARGIGQLMPATVDLVNTSLMPGAGLDPAVPEQNIRLAARFLRYLLDRGNGDEGRALAAYHQGWRSVAETGPKPTSVAYVRAVQALRARFR